MLHIKSRFRTLTRVSKYFDKTSRYNIGALKKIKRGEKYLKIYCKKKTHNHRSCQIALEHFSHIFEEPCRDCVGKRFFQPLSGRKP